jgi:cell wall-associated NlpC family hydrolase
MRFQLVKLFFIFLAKPDLFMKKLILLAPLVFFLISCGSSRTKQHSISKNVEKTTKSAHGAKATSIVDYAKTFEGTRYKFGGTSKKGMDCSGLVYTAFGKENISLPRVSRDMAKKGKRISLSQTTEGDLVFFRTSKNKTSINHVGLVVETRKGEIRFIHSTTSKGVIISSMREKYWGNAFVEARRLIDNI